jgi:23S rRNA (adenine2503-C2)-methyltransferase
MPSQNSSSIPRWLVVTMSMVVWSSVNMAGRRALFAQASSAFVAAPSHLTSHSTRTAYTASTAAGTTPRFASSQATTSRRSTVRDDSVAATKKEMKELSTKKTTTTAVSSPQDAKLLNLSTVTLEDLHTILVDGWGYPKFRVKQVWNWIREQGVTDVDEMTNLPAKLRDQLHTFSVSAALTLAEEQVSTDGTIKRAYRCADGQVIESVLMPYTDGRYTACISSQAGCAQGCVFCATGQMGFSRQLSPDEIFEQVSRFAAELKQQDKADQLALAAAGEDAEEIETLNNGKKHGRSRRLSNIVFMGMGEPLANYRNVVTAINRMTGELGIGARKITVSTVGIVPNIRKLTHDPNVPQIRLAVSLHCATDEERTALLPANKRYGGLDELMSALKDYIETTGQRITLEWALIQGQNDDVETARKLGQLIKRSGLRRDMVHVNVIPLNPTGGFTGGPSGRQRVNAFVQALEKDYGIACTPRVRRGIDIDAGCGQLKSAVLDRGDKQIGPTVKDTSDVGPMEGDLNANEPFAIIDAAVRQSAMPAAPMQEPRVGVYEDEYDNDEDEDEAIFLNVYDGDDEEEEFELQRSQDRTTPSTEAVVLNDEYSLDGSSVDFESDDYEDPTFDEDWQKQEASRLIDLVKGKTMASYNDSSGATSKIVMPSLGKQPKQVKEKTKASSSDSSGAAPKIATPSSDKKPKRVKEKTKASSSDSSGAAPKIATPSSGKKPEQTSGKQPKQASGKHPKQENSRLIDLVKGKAMASKTATPSSGKQP